MFNSKSNIHFLSAFFVFTSFSFNLLANDNYIIELCNGCSSQAMQAKALRFASYSPKIVHIYDQKSGQLEAYLVEMDYASGGDATATMTSPDPVVLSNASAAKDAWDDIPEPTLPASISNDAWDFANFPAKQNQARDWFYTSADWKTNALVAAQMESVLMKGQFQSREFVLHLEGGGKLFYRSTGHLIDGKELYLAIEFASAMDKDGNVVAQSSQELNKIYSLSAGVDGGTASSFANTAVYVYGASSVNFRSPPSSDGDTFSCSFVGKNLQCLKQQ